VILHDSATPQAAAFRRFEHRSWERIARSYASTWALVTCQFGDLLLRALQLAPGMRLLDVACGPGQVAAAAQALGADVIGVDFSRAMIGLARRRHPGLVFRQGDAEALPFGRGQFDVVAMNFGVLHLADPARAFAEARRVLRPGGRFGFSLWAGSEDCAGERIVSQAVNQHADLAVELPAGPPPLRFAAPSSCRDALATAGFAAASMAFATHTVAWLLPSADVLFGAERHAGVRTAALLAGQSPERLAAIREAVRTGVDRHRTPDGFAVPMTAHLVTVTC
jgi:SAM-dependent methyltransferase